MKDIKIQTFENFFSSRKEDEIEILFNEIKQDFKKSELRVYHSDKPPFKQSTFTYPTSKGKLSIMKGGIMLDTYSIMLNDNIIDNPNQNLLKNIFNFFLSA